MNETTDPPDDGLTVGAKYRSFFEESAAEMASAFELALTPEQLSALLAIPLNQSLTGALDVIRSQSVRYERKLRAATEAADPLEEPPGVRLVSCGLRVLPGLK